MEINLFKYKSAVYIQRALRILVVFSISTLFYLNIPSIVNAITTDEGWKEVQESEYGRQWWSPASLKMTDNKIITISTKFLPYGKEKKIHTPIYFKMKIDCYKKRFKDESINGNPKLNPLWEEPKGDMLINNVINDSCKQANLL